MSNGVWKLKRKIVPKHPKSIPVAKQDVTGRIVTSQIELKSLYLDTFIHRLRHRPVKSGFDHLFGLKEDLCRKRLILAKTNKSPEWNPDQSNLVLSSLKLGKSRDPVQSDSFL